ncbi:MAG: hypothetical protein PVJ52_00305 [Candidatus Woesebacteria bacterium]|jgi:hypothetical protein
MSSHYNLKDHPWWDYLHEDLRELLWQSLALIEVVEKWEKEEHHIGMRKKAKDKISATSKHFHDYSFVVFPAAKGYEGFLKTLFLDLGFIKEDDYYGKRFRVGKALNPHLDKRYRKKESVYDKMVDFCGGTDLADVLWRAWKKCRNILFHWFPNEKNAISFKEAKGKVGIILNAMDEAFKECKMEERSK